MTPPSDVRARAVDRGSLVQLVAVVLGGPLLLGLMAKVRARAEGRIGAPIRQPLRWICESC